MALLTGDWQRCSDGGLRSGNTGAVIMPRRCCVEKLTLALGAGTKKKAFRRHGIAHLEARNEMWYGVPPEARKS